MRIKRGEGLNIVPFIDIMLVLLAIILSVSTFIAQGQIPIEVPKASASENPKDERSVVIAIRADNAIFVDEKEVGLMGLRHSLESIPSTTLVELRSDKDSKFDTFIQVLNVLKEKQHEHFTISTQKD
ncbi:TonB system transport protein ExbD [Helicobacter pametensis]|uniref:TonB system transport protein ExbD n=1 Tax=Helicobacter pametensis TaxID=95149 RepID=UPI000487D6C5|nr:TonB system transport protein ExbD [Helicobacter pametensis]